MFYKFLKLILFSTVLVQASPKLFESYANQMEHTKEDCITYQKNTKIPIKLKKKCKKYIATVNKVFKYGYTLDSSVDRDTIDLDKAEKYNQLLHSLEEKKKAVLSLIHDELERAIKESDIKYFTLLLSSDKFKIYYSEYEFMDKHKHIFGKNRQYIKYKKDLEQKEKLRLEKEQRKKDAKMCSDMSNEIVDIYTLALDQIKQGNLHKVDKTYRIALKKKKTFMASECNDEKRKSRIVNGLLDADEILKKNADTLKKQVIKQKENLAEIKREHIRKKEREEKQRQRDHQARKLEKRDIAATSQFRLKGGYFACTTEALFDEIVMNARKKDTLAVGVLLSKGCVLTKKGVRFSLISHASFGVVKIRAYSGTDSIIVYTNFENIPEQR